MVFDFSIDGSCGGFRMKEVEIRDIELPVCMSNWILWEGFSPSETGGANDRIFDFGASIYVNLADDDGGMEEVPEVAFVPVNPEEVGVLLSHGNAFGTNSQIIENIMSYISGNMIKITSQK